MNRSSVLAIGWLIALTGCTGVIDGAGFDAVQASASERLAGAKVHWSRGGPEDAEVARHVSDLLGAELTADSAVQVALLNNPRIQATYEQLGVAQADLVRAGLFRNPVFDLELRFFPGSTSFEAGLVQNFLDLFFVPLRRQVAAERFEAAKARVTAAVIRLAAETRRAFYRVEAAEQFVELRRQVADSTGVAAELSRRILRAGNAPDLEHALELAQHEEARVEREAAEQELRDSREALSVLMGLWGLELAWKAPGRLPALPAEEIAAEEVERRAVERSEDLREARIELEAASRLLGYAAPMAVFEDTELGVSLEHEGEGETGVGPAVSFPVPLFSWGGPASAVARAEYRRRARMYEALATEVRSAARSSWSRLLSLRGRAMHYRDVILPVRGRVLRETQKQFNAMLVGAFQLFTAKQQQIDAGARYVATLRDYWTARADLDALLSGALRAPGGMEEAGTGGAMSTENEAEGGSH